MARLWIRVPKCLAARHPVVTGEVSALLPDLARGAFQEPTSQRDLNHGRRVAVMLMVTLVVAVSRTAVAQQTPRVVSGAVRDSVGRPLENAVIVLDPSEETRATRANAQGRFRFDNVKPGRHELRTTWVGYRPDDRVIEVPAAGFEVEIVLPLLPFKLDTLRIVARRTGALGATVVHSDFRALGGVDVEVMGGREKARTGSDGRFAFPALREGAYLLEAKRADFKTRMISFPVPPNDAVELVVMMDSIITKADRIAENTFRDMEMRWHGRSVANSALVPRHELASQRGQPLIARADLVVSVPFQVTQEVEDTLAS